MKLFKKAKFLKYPRFKFKSSFQNVGRIWVWFQKQSCRTFDFEQLLFLEIFELLQKFGSNLIFKLDGNSVISMNSVHCSCYTAGDLRFASRRGRGRLWRRAGAVKATMQLPCASEPLYLALAVAVCPRSLALFSRRHGHNSGELSPSL